MDRTPSQAPDPAREAALARLAAGLLGTSPEALAKSGIRATAVRPGGEELVVDLGLPEDVTLTLRFRTRDDAQPAYVRTAHLDLSFSASAQNALVPKLFARMVRTLAAVDLNNLRDLAGDLAKAPAAPGSRDRAAEASDEIVLEGTFGGVRLADSFGDNACGMMGALDVLSEVRADLAIVVHGDRGCLPLGGGGDCRTFSSDMRDLDVVGGGESRLEAAVRAVLAFRDTLPEAIVVVSTCLSELIGDDLEDTAARIEAEHGVPVVPVRATGLRPIKPVVVARRCIGALSSRFLPRVADVGDEVAFAGYPDVDGVFLPELRSVLASTGVPFGSIWPEDGLKGLAGLARARCVFFPERAALGPIVKRLEDAGGREVVEHRAPVGVAVSGAFYRAIGARMGRAEAVEGAITRLEADAAVRVARFRERHAGRRVAACFGDNREGTATVSSVHLGIGYVPFLVELGLTPVLVSLTHETAARKAQVEWLARSLGAAPDVYVHRTPDAIVPLLREARVDLAVNENCHKHRIDAAGVAYLRLREFLPGFNGAVRAIDAIESVLS